jgi:tetratricopeptide (TPR) repeat protein
MWRDLQTKDRPEFADTLLELGCVLRDEGKRAEAETNLTEAVAMRRRLFGNEHPDLANSLHFLAEVWFRQGKVVEAETASREALAIHSKLHTNDCVEVADELNNLGAYLETRGNLSEAEAKLSAAVAMRKKVYGSMHFEVARSLHNLTTTLRLEGKLAEAETPLRNDLAIQQRLGNEKIVEARLVDLANLLTAEGKPADAQSRLDQLLSREPLVDVAADLIEQATALRNECDPDRVGISNLLHFTWGILQKVPAQDLVQLPKWGIPGLVDGGFKEQATNLCWRALGSSATNTGWFNEAARFLATAENPSSRDPALAVELAEKATKLNGDANYWNTLGVARYRAGDFKQSLADLEKSAQLDHDLTSFNAFFMAMAYKQLDDADSSRRLYAQAVEWMEKKAARNPDLVRFRTEAEQLLGGIVPAK